jgi:CheY-like chemotaxis protein
MFQPFMQADPSYSRKRGGSGLGLTIAARLIEAMKGSIHLESAPGKGSTFHVLLPLPPATMTAAPPATAPDRLEPLRVLVAEDNPVNQLVAVRMLQRMGHVVDVAADGQQAIDAFHAGAYDLVLMDCQMPGIDGFEATRRIRKLENTGRTPVIAITAHAMEGAREQCLQAGMDDYLAKPLTLEKLSALLQVWCRGVRATRVR